MAAVQILNPGEAAPAHRHTPAAVRFVLEGQGVWTLVDGDPVVMRPGDLVLTPSWCWHEHHSDGSGPMLWFDGLDLPMSRALDAVFFENGETETVTRAVDAVSASEQLYGAPGLVPDDGPEQAAPPHSPLYVYRWPANDSMLDRLIRVRTGDGRVSPISGATDNRRRRAADAALHRHPRGRGCPHPDLAR